MQKAHDHGVNKKEQSTLCATLATHPEHSTLEGTVPSRHAVQCYQWPADAELHPALRAQQALTRTTTSSKSTPVSTT